MEDIQQLREGFDQKVRPYSNEPTVSIEQVMINAVNCYWFTPGAPDPTRIVIYLHGGGHALGSVRSHEGMVSHLAKKLQARILLIDYALAPESPFPASINDVLKVYRELTVSYPGYGIAFIGDSSGGGLVVSVIGEILKKRFPSPQAVLLISPWISLTCKYPSYEENAEADPLLTVEMLRRFANMYTGNTPLEISSPESAQFTQFPPVLVMVGSKEVLVDECRSFYDNIKSIQHRSKLSIYDSQPHVWPRKDIHSEAAQQALAEMEEFFHFYS